MNGKAAPLVARHDVILFDVDLESEHMMQSVAEMCQARVANSKIIALAEKDLPLSKARELRRAGVDDVLPRDALREEIIPQIETIRMSREAQLPALWAGQTTQGKVIAVAKSRGGAGASTFAVNLANELQGHRRYFKKVPTAEVAIVDLDLQFGSIAALLDVEESDAFWRMAMDGTVPDSAFLEQAMAVSSCGLSVLTAPSRYGPLTAIDAEQISAMLSVLKAKFDYIVLDLPSALVEWIEPITAQADLMYLVTDVTVPSVRSARKLIDFYLGENPALEIELVANQEKKPLIPASHHRAASELLSRDFHFWVPRDERAFRETIDRGVPIATVSPRSAAAKAIRNIARATKDTLPPRSPAH
jgi:Flp pilus assembly CpaE family ATPase